MQADQPDRHPTAETPEHRVVILGAGRGLSGGLPPALRDVGPGSRVLDWLIGAFASLRGVHFDLVGGYRFGAFLDLYPHLHLRLNPRWRETGPVGSLALVSLASRRATWVSYGDVVFRADVVDRLEASGADLTIAVDGRWRDRYEARAARDIDRAEKVRWGGARFDCGAHIAAGEADGEYAGLLRLTPAAADRLQRLLAEGAFDPASALPALLRGAVERGLRWEVVDLAGQWAELNAPQDLARFVLGTKAESLERLRPLVRKGAIHPQCCFTRRAFGEDRAARLAEIRRTLDGAGAVIVRSSAAAEDGFCASGAGAHRSVLDVPMDDDAALGAAVAEVLDSYGSRGEDDQVLVQAMLREVVLSGVVLTRAPGSGAPYYVINFDDETDRTDAVTSGTGRDLRTVYLLRGAALGPGLPAELSALVEAVGELEALVGHDSLDLEFAFTAGSSAPHILQVRPIVRPDGGVQVEDDAVARGLSLAAEWLEELRRTPLPSLVGATTHLSTMSDWNPGEIVGTKPKRLALSLYRHLITDEVWASQRAEVGYRDVRPCTLVHEVLGHPYVDLRATFSSFVPAALPDEVAARLVDHYLERVAARPELHDKVEFDPLITCLACDHEARAAALRRAGFAEAELQALAAGLRRITREVVERTPVDLRALESMPARFERIATSGLPPLERAWLHLEQVRRVGAPVFCRLARSGFVATTLLRSLVSDGCLSEERAEELVRSIRTVSGELQRLAAAVAAGEAGWEELLARFGHLRPGTYDITSPRYDHDPERFLRPLVAAPADGPPAREGPPAWDEATRRAVEAALERLDVGLDLARFLAFAREAIGGREEAKFLFTRDLSAALEALAEVGARWGVGREDLAHVRIADLLALRSPAEVAPDAVLRRLAEEGEAAYQVTQAVCLPGLILSPGELRCFEERDPVPNYCTQRVVRAPLVAVDGKRPPPREALEGRVALIPNADPGYDWLFSCGIAGLVTMLGGANSHMTVRAHEFGLPAAVGVGERLYRSLLEAAEIELDCGARRIRVVLGRRDDLAGGRAAP